MEWENAQASKQLIRFRVTTIRMSHHHNSHAFPANKHRSADTFHHTHNRNKQQQHEKITRCAEFSIQNIVSRLLLGTYKFFSTINMLRVQSFFFSDVRVSPPFKISTWLRPLNSLQVIFDAKHQNYFFCLFSVFLYPHTGKIEGQHAKKSGTF